MQYPFLLICLNFFLKLNDEFLRRPLGAIGDEVFEIGENLERLPQQMIECLRTVINCKEYIFWLRKEVKGDYSYSINHSSPSTFLIADWPTILQ